MAIRLGTSSYDGATLLLTHSDTECTLDTHEVSKDLLEKLKVYKAGSRCTSARGKKKLGLSTMEGENTFAVCGVPTPREDPP